MPVKELNALLIENETLIRERDELTRKLNEAKEVIEAIKTGNIDALFIANSEVLVSSIADHTYRSFIENMAEGLVTLHTDGMVLFCNSAFARMINLPIEQVIGSGFRSFIPSEYQNAFEHFFHGDEAYTSKMELSLINREGTRNHFIVSLNRLQLAGVPALNLVWTDVTDQKAVQERLRIVNENLKKAIEEGILSENKVSVLYDRLKGNVRILEDANNELATFAHIASHDLQEPLRKILTYSTMLTRDYGATMEAPAKRYLENMRVSAERMRRLINDILEYSELSRKDLLFKPTNLQSVVEEIFSNLEIVIDETHAKIAIEKPLPVIDANATQMRQLFQNVLSNALKFIRQEIIPEISITYDLIDASQIKETGGRMSGEQFCRIRIRDNGIGFKAEYGEQIFDVFQRLHGNSVYQGTGIGLAICKKIVEQHNGFIGAESTPDVGSLFTITLPVVQHHDQNNEFDTTFIL